MVMPSWVAARLESRLARARSSALAFILPAATSSTTRLRRTATSENSAATKKPLAATRTNTASRPPKSDIASFRLSRLVAGKGDAVHDTAVTMVVVDRIVHGRAIVPEGERAHLPAEAAGEFRQNLVRPQEAE